MGLDMYGWAMPASPALVDIGQELEGGQEFMYWRKHPNLHGWMEQLFVRKGGDASDGFCTSLRLTAADLDALEADLTKLPYTAGFFFGASPTPEDDPEGFADQVAKDRAFVAKAREMIRLGMAVYYDSSW